MSAEIRITDRHLKVHTNHIFVFGDNTIRKGKKGAASLRDNANTYGFITKKLPDNKDSSFYRPKEYSIIYNREINNLISVIKEKQDYLFMISRLGAGLTNKYKIFDKIIEPNIKEDLSKFKNILWLW